MKILLSALACEPGKGSELEVGFRALLAAASRHEVWVLTNSATVPLVRKALEQYPWADRVHLEGIYFDVDDQLYPQLTTPGFHWYYDRWQRKAAVLAAELDRRIDFDVVHHVSLAANWTRAGVAVVNKPLVWGPVGGGVEMPLSLLTELGWRGVVDEIARTAARRLLARIGPARRMRERAVVIFAQNGDTARLLESDPRQRVLSNATSVDLGWTIPATGPRRKDIVFAARLLPWKGGRLAVRALRYVRHPDAVLRIFGNGPDRRRIARCAAQWGVADRVLFEGRVPRDELLRVVATAGVFLHPSFHEEAGLAVAEALALGTPVVCLDHGGPPELLPLWPGAPASTIQPRWPERTARDFGAAIDRHLCESAPVATTARRAVISFEQELLAAYDVALASHRDVLQYEPTGWGFPARKPQVFARTPAALSKAVRIYGFGRRLSRWTQAALAMHVQVPFLRRVLAEPVMAPPPVCGWITWSAIQEELRRRNGEHPLEWIHFHSPWGKQRSNMLALNRDGTPRFFVVIEPNGFGPSHYDIPPTTSFRVAACTDSFQHDTWSVRQSEALPPFHRPAKWNAHKIRRVAEEVSLVLDQLLPRPAGTPAHWRPMHGDYVPWNVREDRDGQVWLIDWEDAGWGPPLADLVRYLVAYHSFGWVSPSRIADIVRRTAGAESAPALFEVARFWLSHPNLQLGSDTSPVNRRVAKDSARAAREVAAFRALESAVEDSG
jgi:glycosyltransferase involved in cell wall biosynthesis